MEVGHAGYQLTDWRWRNFMVVGHRKDGGWEAITFDLGATEEARRAGVNIYSPESLFTWFRNSQDRNGKDPQWRDQFTHFTFGGDIR